MLAFCEFSFAGPDIIITCSLWVFIRTRYHYRSPRSRASKWKRKSSAKYPITTYNQNEIIKICGKVRDVGRAGNYIYWAMCTQHGDSSYSWTGQLDASRRSWSSAEPTFQTNSLDLPRIEARTFFFGNPSASLCLPMVRSASIKPYSESEIRVMSSYQRNTTWSSASFPEIFRLCMVLH